MVFFNYSFLEGIYSRRVSYSRGWSFRTRTVFHCFQSRNPSKRRISTAEFHQVFYFQTATSIGKNKKPKNVTEILFMTTSWLLGVFVFAILIGDIRDIVGNARRNALTFQRQLDAITTYMNNNKVAKSVQVSFPECLRFASCLKIIGIMKG